jgi:hypothetical protein
VLPDLDGHAAELLVQALAIGQIALERVLDRDRDPLDVEIEPAWVDPAGTVAEHAPDAPGQKARERRVVDGCELADRRDPGGPEALLGPRPHTREPPGLERRQERGFGPGRYHDEPAGLAPVARNLGHDLAGGDADRARQARRRPHRRLHRLGHHACSQEVARHLAQVEVPLVEPRPLDGRHDLAHGRPDPP